MADHVDRWNRRSFIRGAAVAGAAAVVGLRAEPAIADPPPETTRVRLVRIPAICLAPEYVAEELLRGEGFTDVQYVKKDGTVGIERALASGEADVNMHFVAPAILRLDAGDPVVMLAGGHVGCLELFGADHIKTIRDLKGKTIAIPELRSSPHVFIASMMAYVGLDPSRDVRWAEHPPSEMQQLLTAGKIDAFMASPPFSQDFRAKGVGHVVVNSAVDRPWSNYFCCMVIGNREFVRRHPVATKRALRAILKAADICALEPERTARLIVDGGFTPRYDYALQSMKEIPYTRWREFDPEDTVRFYALRLHEIGMLKSSPQKIIAQGTNWRFLKELKKELKG
jgi:NitT/TauT family transport system substrate-binding protein